MSTNGIGDPNKDKNWLHSAIYDRSNAIKNPLPRKSIFKFGTLKDALLNAGKLIGQNLISWFLLAILYIFLIDPAIRHDDQYFLVASEIVKLICVTISVFLAVKVFESSDIVGIGLRFDRRAINDFLFGFGLIFLIFTCEFFLEWASGWIKIEHGIWETQSFTNIFWNILVNLIIFIFVGWSEELLSRGYQLRILSRGLNRPLGIILSSVIFSFMHRYNPEITVEGYFFIFLAGIVMSLAFLRTGQLWLAIGLHAGWDFFGGVIFGRVPPIFGSGIFHLMEIKLVYLPSPYPIFDIPSLIILTILVYFYTTDHKPEISEW